MQLKPSRAPSPAVPGLCVILGLPHPVSEVKLISCVKSDVTCLFTALFFSLFPFFLIHRKAGSGDMHHRHLGSENSMFLIQKSRCGHFVMATVKQVNRVEQSSDLSPVTCNLFGISTL